MKPNGNSPVSDEDSSPIGWAPILGHWSVGDNQIAYKGWDERFAAHGQEFPIGILCQQQGTSQRRLPGGCGVRRGLVRYLCGRYYLGLPVPGTLLFGFLSRIRGVILVPGVVPSSVRGQFP